MGSIKLPAKECYMRKVFAFSNSNNTHPNVIKTSVEPTLHAAAKPKCTKNSGRSRLRMCDSSKVTQNVFAFGPAHAEQARKLYQVKQTQNEERQTGCKVSKRFNRQFGRHILLSNHASAQSVYHTSSLAKRASSILGECNAESQKIRVQHSLMRQPLVRIASIQQRPNGKSVSKPKHSLEIECNVYTNEGFVKEEPSKCEDKTGPKCTIFQLLEEMSSLSI